MMNKNDIIFDGQGQSGLGRIVVAGMFTQKKEFDRKPVMRKLRSYALVYVTDGQGDFHDANGFHHHVRKGDLFFLFPEIGHTYGPRKGATWNELYIVFEGPVFDLWYDQGLLNPQKPIIHLAPVDYWFEQLKHAIWSIPQTGSTYSLARICQLQNVLSKIFLHKETLKMEKVDEKWLAQAKMLLDDNLNTKPDYEAIASKLSMSYRSFRLRFTDMANATPGKYRNYRLMDQASEMLATGNMPFKQIASELGFCDEFHFSKRFKQITGMGPKAFQKALRQ